MVRGRRVTSVKEFPSVFVRRNSVRGRSIAVTSPNWVVLLACVVQAMPTDVGHRVLRCGIMAWKQCVRCRWRVSCFRNRSALQRDVGWTIELGFRKGNEHGGHEAADG
ncbi:predicted protein [Streptomyces viridosporus ATCC 14672]|uniref:Predicted protein n=1 Tax=Streptomyces viridosporus (strain ATCC 14672 / DSM 40746 / JCM 4963 / KCTC 9882 / NRRL B-12104 / FH 1290) TaxID=566461 RepID=D5ZZ35_STRV1|nr:predicted protein [Streptomyces viridosporus ATCC 14672]